MSTEDKKDDKQEKGSKGNPLTKEDILEILGSEPIASLKQPVINALDRSGLHPGFHLVKGLGFTLLLAAGMVGYYIQWSADIKQRQTEATARAAEEVQKSIDRQIEWQIKLNNAMGNLKQVVETIQLKCKDNVPISLHQQNEERLAARWGVVYAMMGVQYIFDQSILDGARDYILFDESVPDVCAKDAPSEMAWRKILIKNNDLMGEVVKKNQNLLSHLNLLDKLKNSKPTTTLSEND